MKPKEPVETGQRDMFRSRLDQIIHMSHEKVILARVIDWQFLSDKCGENYIDKPGHPALSTRLMAGLHILKYADNLSDEELCARWVENPYYQYFCGEEFFCHELPFDRSSMTRWRQRMGEEKIAALHQESLSVAVRVEPPRVYRRLQSSHDPAAPGYFRLGFPWRMQVRSGRTEILTDARNTPQPDPVLIKALRTTHTMITMDISRNPVLDTAPTTPWRRQLVRLAFLAPDIQRAILEGRQPRDLTLAELMKSEIPLRWSEQHRKLGVENSV